MSDPNELHREVFLVAENGVRMRCWLPAAGLKVGMRLTLKDLDPEKTWTITECGQTLLRRSALNKEWHVGGL